MTEPSPAGPAERAGLPRPASPPLAEQILHVASALAAVQDGRSLTEVLAQVPERLRPGVQALTFDVLRHLGMALALSRHLVPKPPAPAVEYVLLVGLALGCASDTPGYPAHTLVSQTVEAAKRRVPHQAGLINAVLRRALRERDALLSLLAVHPQARWNHPMWWIQRLRADWPGQADALLAANLRHPPMTLRVNARIKTASAYIHDLANQGLSGVEAGSHTVILDRPCPVQRLPGFAQGEVSVQDAAAQGAAPLLLGDGLPTGARVLDACAAPGGKTAHLLELADLQLLALDSDAKRLEKVSDNLRRLGLQAELRAGDAGAPASWWDGRPFDAILLDAPCSASGIVRRHPDIPWLRRPEDPAALAVQQARLLDALWPLLAPGGRLLYASCSVFKEEGQGQIDAFLQRASGAKVLPSPGHLLPLPDNASLAATGHDLPAADGFFYGLLEKSAG